MNRLILIGNGFDLAHGLKTAYNDFIIWYLSVSLEETNKHGKYEDELLHIVCTDYTVSLSSMKSFREYVEHFYKKGSLEPLFEKRVKPYQDVDMEVPVPFAIEVRSKFLKSLFSNCSFNRWVDIENFYYQSLKDILKSDRASEKESELKSLNLSLEKIVLLLEKYLQTIKIQNFASAYNKILSQELEPREFTKWDDIEKQKLENTLFLNFNYTSTIEYYFSGLTEGQKISTNYIHGKLSKKDNPMIFGFGDELDEDYKKIEVESTKGFFTFIKSFWYFKTTNYHHLLRFMESEQYQVFILGHSCGLSDRTMLNMIFEHQNCVSIKPYYYVDPSGKNNYIEITQEISRHFKSKSELRRKIVSFPFCSEMPQITQE